MADAKKQKIVTDESVGMACFAAKDPLKEWHFPLKKFNPDDVDIKVVYCGVCHSDIHTIRGEWGEQNFPLVPGHEIVGYITRVGENVKGLRVGQRVGVGPQCLSCFRCTECNSHRENYCIEGFLDTYGAKIGDGYISQGGYAHHQRIHSRFVIPIPDSLPSDAAAPLLCAGITTYAPLKYLNVGPGMKVGVLGIGGLGHLAIRFAAAMGAHVVALSSSEGKREEAKRLGAHEFLVHTKPEECAKHKKSFDVILCTVSGKLNLEMIIDMIMPHGTFSNVGLPEEDMQIPPKCFLRDIYVRGTLIGSPSEISDMLDFCAKHKILPDIEVVPLSKANEAIEWVLENKARYRYVLSIDAEYDQEQQKK